MGERLGLATITLLAFGVAGFRFWRRLRPLASAGDLNRFDHPMQRLLGVWIEVGLHRRLLKLRLSGVLHLMIFVSFFVLMTAVLEAFGQGLFPGFSLRLIGGQTWIALLQDVFALVMLIGVALASYIRYVVRPDRLRGSNGWDAAIILALITIIVVAMETNVAFSIASKTGGSSAWRPVAGSLALAFEALHLNLLAGEDISFWLHVGAILAFLIYIPASKHLHMFVGIPNILFRDLDSKGVLPEPAKSESTAGVPQSKTIFDLPWKGMLDLYACTECGRCQSACPAYAAGLPLSPKTLIMDLRDHLVATESGRASAGAALAGPVIAAETLWACTTCRACMEVCPLHIEHVPKIVELRRDLVDEGAVEPMLQDALGSLLQYGNSFKKPAKQRTKWTTGLDFKIIDARKQPVDLLWFVGDFASFDPRAQRVTRMVATILQRAGVDFGMLYDGERNSGNDVRRAGDEGLFRMLAEHNVEQLAKASFRRIMTTDPHSLNALGQEYRVLGTKYEVVHYTQILSDLLSGSALGQLRSAAGATATYHDPCYLGRYAGAYDAPRRILEHLGYRVHEMPRCRENSFCCGAGGGRIWADDTSIIERPSENRIKEALALGDATTFAVACPKDIVMYSSAVQTLGVGDRISVKDLGELVFDSLSLH